MYTSADHNLEAETNRMVGINKGSLVNSNTVLLGQDTPPSCCVANIYRYTDGNTPPLAGDVREEDVDREAPAGKHYLCFGERGLGVFDVCQRMALDIESAVEWRPPKRDLLPLGGFTRCGYHPVFCPDMAPFSL